MRCYIRRSRVSALGARQPEAARPEQPPQRVLLSFALAAALDRASKRLCHPSGWPRVSSAQSWGQATGPPPCLAQSPGLAPCRRIIAILHAGYARRQGCRHRVTRGRPAVLGVGLYSPGNYSAQLWLRGYWLSRSPRCRYCYREPLTVDVALQVPALSSERPPVTWLPRSATSTVS